MGDVIFVLGALKYILFGLIFGLLGFVVFGDGQRFMARSEAVDLRVMDVESHRDHDRRTRYRAVFALADDTSGVEPFAGNVWSATAPHEVGQIVPGRIDRQTGEMRSDTVIGQYSWAFWIAQLVALACVLQGVVMLMGVPEERLPLRLRSGRRRERFYFRG